MCTHKFNTMLGWGVYLRNNIIIAYNLLSTVSTECIVLEGKCFEFPHKTARGYTNSSGQTTVHCLIHDKQRIVKIQAGQVHLLNSMQIA